MTRYTHYKYTHYKRRPEKYWLFDEIWVDFSDPVKTVDFAGGRKEFTEYPAYNVFDHFIGFMSQEDIINNFIQVV